MGNFERSPARTKNVNYPSDVVCSINALTLSFKVSGSSDGKRMSSATDFVEHVSGSVTHILFSSTDNTGLNF